MVMRSLVQLFLSLMLSLVHLQPRALRFFQFLPNPTKTLASLLIQPQVESSTYFLRNLCLLLHGLQTLHGSLDLRLLRLILLRQLLFELLDRVRAIPHEHHLCSCRVLVVGYCNQVA
jgi:hypothetical protein